MTAVDREPADLGAPRVRPIRFHHLKAMGRCGAHALEALRSDGEETLAQRIGAGVHAMVFGKPVVKWDQLSKAAKSGKSKSRTPTKAPRSGEDWEAFRAANPGAVILTAKEWDHAAEMSAAIRAHGPASRLLFADGAIHERTIFFTQRGRARRSTPDVRHPSFVCELKTTKDASPDRFLWDARKLGYHAQLADQCAAIEAETGRRPREAFIVAIEKARPHVIQVYELSRNALEQGERLAKSWLDDLLVAEASGVWRGYHPGIVEFDVPTEEDRGGWFEDGWYEDDDEDEAGKENGDAA